MDINEFIEEARKNAEQCGAGLINKKSSLSGAESCTGGLVSKILTDTAGASKYFQGAVVTYSNEAKTHFIGVKNETLETVGAVSGECAAQMAAGAKREFCTGYGFSTTGIAGPEGGTEEKPVGTVYFGIAEPDGNVLTYHKTFAGDRNEIRIQAADFILKELKNIINHGK